MKQPKRRLDEQYQLAWGSNLRMAESKTEEEAVEEVLRHVACPPEGRMARGYARPVDRFVEVVRLGTSH